MREEFLEICCCSVICCSRRKELVTRGGTLYRMRVACSVLLTPNPRSILSFTRMHVLLTRVCTGDTLDNSVAFRDIQKWVGGWVLGGGVGGDSAGVGRSNVS